MLQRSRKRDTQQADTDIPTQQSEADTDISVGIATKAKRDRRIEEQREGHKSWRPIKDKKRQV